MTNTQIKDKIVRTVYDSPGLTMSSLCRTMPKIKIYQVRKMVSELTGAGIIQPIPKGSHDGIRLAKKNV